MRPNARLTACAIAVVCLIFTQLNVRVLAQDSNSTNRQSQVAPAAVSNVAQNSPANQTPAQQTTPTDSNKKQGKSVKKWILIGVGAAAAFTVVLFMTKSEPQPQVSIGVPSVGGPQ